MPYTEVNNTTSFKLTLIAKKATAEPNLIFNALMHLLNETYLYECFCELKAHKAPGIDKRTLESYKEEEIKEAIKDTVAAMKAHTYQPEPVRRVFIKKANGKLRPLGIPTVMDKTLQLAVSKILEAIFEPAFLDLSYGFRPARDAHQALKAVDSMIMGEKVSYVIDADIKGFFDNVDHSWMIKCLKIKISDPNFLNLINKFLKAGAMIEGKFEATSKGTPQGGIISPLLANIYLHYVLDLWFNVKERKAIAGYAGLVRYADDFVIGVQYKHEAIKLLEDIKLRFAEFGLSLAEDKTRILEFGRFAKENSDKDDRGKPETFDFLGFTHYCGQTRDGRFALKHKTSRKKFNLAITAQNQWFKKIRNIDTLPNIWKILASKLRGHYQYYGISGNIKSTQNYYWEIINLAYKWMNRRSQKKTWNYEELNVYLKKHPLPQPRITYALYNT